MQIFSTKTNIRNQRNGKRSAFISEINVTPMVDVMLVLLIIFMITSPMLVVGMDVDLPKTDSHPIAAGQYKPLVISISKQNEIFIFETKITRTNLVDKLKNITKENKETRIFVKGDQNVPYGQIVNVMSEIYSAGFTKVSLISDIKKK